VICEVRTDEWTTFLKRNKNKQIYNVLNWIGNTILTRYCFIPLTVVSPNCLQDPFQHCTATDHISFLPSNSYLVSL